MRTSLTLPSLLVFVCLGSAPIQAQWSMDSLSTARAELSAVTVGNYALFAGGRDGMTLTAKVDIYNHATDTWTAYTFLEPRTYPAATVVGNYALFAGGSTSFTTETATIAVFDATNATWSRTTLSQARTGFAATTVGSKAIFAGGIFGGLSAPTTSARVDIYDSAVGVPGNPLAWSWSDSLSVARGGLAAATVGSKAIFAGGLSGVTVSSTVDIYDDTTGAWSIAQLSQARRLTPEASVAIGDFAYFAGGQISANGYSDVVDIYNLQTGLWTNDVLSRARSNLAAAAIGNTAIFAGGYNTTGPLTVVDALNVGTDKWSSSTPLSGPRNAPAAIAIGGKVLIAGGFLGGGVASASIDVYEPAGINDCLAAANSTGGAATINSSGSSSLLANDLVLRATCMPDEPFIFFHGATSQQVPFGDGFLCAGGGLVRINPAGLAAGGIAEASIDLPLAGITSPGVRRFQCWFRDPAAGGSGFNTSDALEVSFTL